MASLLNHFTSMISANIPGADLDSSDYGICFANKFDMEQMKKELLCPIELTLKERVQLT